MNLREYESMEASMKQRSGRSAGGAVPRWTSSRSPSSPSLTFLPSYLLTPLPPYLLALLPLLLVGCGSPAVDGRQGNAHYAVEDYAGAAGAYERGLDAFESDADRTDVQAGLLNNLGMARYRLENYEGAREAFAFSAEQAATDVDGARAAYNRGNTAFALGDSEGALEAYRQALLLQPDHDDAKFNYEFVARQMQEEQQEQEEDEQERPEPSDYARQLKAQAETLVAQRQYRAAYDLMMEGLQADPTVRAFESFITRTGEVADINEQED